MNIQKSAWILPCLVAALSAGAANAAVAQVPEHSMVVKFDPNALNTDQGVREVYRRIKAAAQEVCPLPSGTLLVSDTIQACRNEAIARAIHSIDNPRLAAVAGANANKG